MVTDGRRPDLLRDGTAGRSNVVPIAGDVTCPGHRAELRAAVLAQSDRLDLLVNNASKLGPSPQPHLAGYPLEVLRDVYEVNVLAPLALLAHLTPLLTAAGGVVVNISSDAAVEPYPGWGGYGSAKAALDQLSRIYAAENPEIRTYAIDPGDMATELHQQAFPGEDISDRPAPETVVPALLRLLDERPPSGRYRAGEPSEPAAR